MIIISDLDNDENMRFFGNQHILFSPQTAEIKKCVGCFRCWVSTPGCCVFDDVSRAINEAIIKDSELLIITKVTFGGYSPFVKKVLERGLPNILPFFKVVNKKTHHAPRYENYPNITVIGYGEDITEAEKEIFKELVCANAINMQNRNHRHFILTHKEEIPECLGGAYHE